MRIRKAQLDQLTAQAKREKRAALARQLAADDPAARVEPDTGRITLRDARGYSSVAEVSDQGLISIRTAEGREYRIERDVSGAVTALDATGHTRYDVTYQDSAPVLIARDGNALVRLAYSPENGTVSAGFPDGAVDTLRFDLTGQQLLSATDALGNTTELVRNNDGHVVELKDARGFSTAFELDEEGEPLATRFPDGTVESYLDTETGVEIQRSDGTVTTVDTDDSDELESVRFGDGTHVSFTFANGNAVEASNGLHGLKCSYSDLGLLNEEALDDKLVKYTFDGDGNLEKLSDGTQSLRYRYDGDDLLTSVSAWDQGQIELDYARSGQISSIRFPNGVATAIEASSAGHIRTVITSNSSVTRGRSVVEERYSYDSRDRVVSRSRLGRVVRFDYDAGGRLTTVWRANEAGRDEPLERFAYDETGNPTSIRGRRATFDAMNRIEGLGDARFEHDSAGNIVRRVDSNGDHVYRYNGQGLLIEAVDRDGSVRFTYDAFGRRVSKERGSERTEFLWAGRQLLREERSVDGSVVEQREYLYYPGQFLPLAVRINGEVFYYHTDRAGTVLALTDSGGAVAWQAEYSAFGEAHAVVEKISQPIRQLGQYHDRETGLYYNLFRYYDPTLGRYISADPIRYASGTPNFYAYADNDPINRSDPEGHLVIPAALLIVAGAAIVGGLIGGAISAASGEGFWKGAAAGAVAGAIGAAAPILAAAAGLSGAALVAAALLGDAVAGGVQSCMEGGASLGTFVSGAAIALVTTVATFGLAKIPGVRRVLGAVGRRLGQVTSRVHNSIRRRVVAAQISVRRRANARLKRSPRFQDDMKKAGVSKKQVADMSGKRVPLGFKNREQYERFQRELGEALRKDGLDDAEVGMKGTSTTFYSENPSKPLGHHWDSDPLKPGDYDLNLTSEKMVAKMKGSGVSSSEQYGIYRTRDIEANHPAVRQFAKKWSRELGRDVNVVGYPAPQPRDPTEFLVGTTK